MRGHLSYQMGGDKTRQSVGFFPLFEWVFQGLFEVSGKRFLTIDLDLQTRQLKAIK